MGTSKSKNTNEYKIQHERFQKVKILSDDEIQIDVYTTLDNYNTWKTNLRKINFSNKENILFPLNHSFIEDGFCSLNTGCIKIVYEKYPFVFQEQLQNRIPLVKHLTEQEMWYLLYTLVSTAKDFSQINKKVGDIRPHNIFVNQVGQIKLAVCFSWPNQLSNLQKTMNHKQITYLAPQQLDICKNHKIQTIINSIVAESFSIGLTMLHAGLLFSCCSIYNLQKFQINKKILDEMIKKWMQLQFIDQNNNNVSYTSSLKEIVRNLCIYDYHTRQKSTEIFTLLQPHKDAILSIQPFQLKYKANSRNKQIKKQSYYNLQNSSGYPIYNYADNCKFTPTIQTTYSNYPNYDLSTRTFTPVYNNHLPTNYHLQFFQKYANTSTSPPKIGEVNIKLTNTISQTEVLDNNKQINYTQNLAKPELITVKPFLSINQENQKNAFKQIILSPLEGQLERKVQSKNYLHVGSGQHLSEIHHAPQRKGQSFQKKAINKFQIKSSANVQDPSSQFLKKIDEQIRRSKLMFPSI